MAFNFFNILGSLFGDKKSRDYKAIKPIVDEVLAIYPEMSSRQESGDRGYQPENPRNRD